MATIFSAPQSSLIVGSASTCAFCHKGGFKRLGNHLPRCPERKGRDYSLFLSKKTLSKRAKSSSCKFKFCPRCHKSFSRLDTHLRPSATCRSVPCPISVHSMPHSTSESSSCSTLPSNVPLQPSESTSITPQSVSCPSGAADLDPFPRPTCSTPQSATATFEPTPEPKSQLPHSAQEWQKANTFLAHDVVPRVLQASSIEDIMLVEGIFNYFAATYGTKEKKRTCKRGKGK